VPQGTGTASCRVSRVPRPKSGQGKEPCTPTRKAPRREPIPLARTESELMGAEGRASTLNACYHQRYRAHQFRPRSVLGRCSGESIFSRTSYRCAPGDSNSHPGNPGQGPQPWGAASLAPRRGFSSVLSTSSDDLDASFAADVGTGVAMAWCPASVEFTVRAS